MFERIKKIEIPVIESEEGGYWAITSNEKVWHPNGRKIKKDNTNPFMNLEETYNKQKESRKEDSDFIALGSGESFEGQFLGVEETTGKFGEQNSYTFVVDGKEKVLNSKSFKLLQNMIEAGVKEGDKVKITKDGEGFQTTYKVEKLK